MHRYPKHKNSLWILVLLLGLFFDFLFWMKPVGVNFAIFSMACLAGGFGLMLVNGLRPNPRSLWLLVPFFFFAAISFLRREPLTIFLAFTFSLFSLGVMANTYLGGRWAQYNLPDYLSRFLNLLISTVINGGGFYSKIRRDQIERGETNKIPAAAILRGLALAFPIVLCFSTLLASADLVFDQKLNELLDFFNVEDINEGIQRIVTILVCAYLLAGAFLHIFSNSGDEKLIGEDKPVVKPFLGFTESAIVMGGVSILFLLFVMIQFRYFFGGQTNIGVDGFTYSQYARRGFSELNTVAFFSLLLIFGLNVFTRHETGRQRQVYSGLSIFMVALVMVILFSSYQRLALTIDWHGYSRLRLYPRTFLIWMGVLLVVVVTLQALQRERYFAFAFVLASLGFAATLTFVNVDRSIVLHNIPRYLQGKNLNVAHLSSLSTDAIPALVEEFRNPNYPVELHEGIGAILLCYSYSHDIVDDNSLDDWRSFYISSWQAHAALSEVQPLLVDYQILKKRYPMLVRTPENIQYECGD